MSLSGTMDKKSAPFGGWVKLPFDRLHQSTNIDTYSCSPSDSADLFCGFESTPVISSTAFNGKQDVFIGQSNTVERRRPSVSNPTSPSTTKPMAGKTIETLMREAGGFSSGGFSSAPSSKEVSPSSTPHGSPAIPRKKVDHVNMKLNSKKWYSGFFAPEQNSSNIHYTDGGNQAKFKKFYVSNFDINVVSPTSW